MLFGRYPLSVVHVFLRVLAYLFAVWTGDRNVRKMNIFSELWKTWCKWIEFDLHLRTLLVFPPS